jgi:hypothetical protein
VKLVVRMGPMHHGGRKTHDIELSQPELDNNLHQASRVEEELSRRPLVYEKGLTKIWLAVEGLIQSFNQNRCPTLQSPLVAKRGHNSELEAVCCAAQTGTGQSQSHLRPIFARVAISKAEYIRPYVRIGRCLGVSGTATLVCDNTMAQITP